MKDPAARTEVQDEPDAQIIDRVRSGDRDAYRLLVRRYQDALYRRALRDTGEPDAAADLVQTAFVRAYENIWRCRDPERFAAWLYRILVNAVRDHLKSARRRDVSLDTEGETLPLADPSDPVRDAETSDLRARLENALRSLGDTMREAFVLKHVDGRSYEEMTELLGVSIPALKMRVHRAREMLREALASDE